MSEDGMKASAAEVTRLLRGMERTRALNELRSAAENIGYAIERLESDASADNYIRSAARSVTDALTSIAAMSALDQVSRLDEAGQRPPPPIASVRGGQWELANLDDREVKT